MKIPIKDERKAVKKLLFGILILLGVILVVFVFNVPFDVSFAVLILIEIELLSIKVEDMIKMMTNKDETLK